MTGFYVLLWALYLQQDLILALNFSFFLGMLFLGGCKKCIICFELVTLLLSCI